MDEHEFEARIERLEALIRTAMEEKAAEPAKDGPLLQPVRLVHQGLVGKLAFLARCVQRLAGASKAYVNQGGKPGDNVARVQKLLGAIKKEEPEWYRAMVADGISQLFIRWAKQETSYIPPVIQTSSEKE